MKTACSLLVILVAVTLAAAACGGGSSSSVNTTPSAEAEELRDRVVAAMNEVDSYRVEIDLRTIENTTIEYKKPNDYRSLVKAMDNQTHEWTLGELLYVDDMIYARKCEPGGDNCGPWDSTQRRDVIVGAGSPSYFPQWPIVALELASGFELSQDSSPDRGKAIVLSGSVNHVRAVVENAARLSPGASLAEQLAAQEPDLTFAEEHPSRLDVWVDPDNSLIQRVKLTVVQRNESGTALPEATPRREFDFTYSKYNEITIEAPE